TSFSQAHQFLKAGNLTIGLTLTDMNGGQTTASAGLTVNSLPPPPPPPSNPGPPAGTPGGQTVVFATANERLIARLYQDIVQREASSVERATMAGMLDHGVSLGLVVQGFLSSLEYRVLQVQTAYQLLLHRAADPSGLASSANMLAAGGTV